MIKFDGWRKKKKTTKKKKRGADRRAGTACWHHGPFSYLSCWLVRFDLTSWSEPESRMALVIRGKGFFNVVNLLIELVRRWGFGGLSSCEVRTTSYCPRRKVWGWNILVNKSNQFIKCRSFKNMNILNVRLHRTILAIGLIKYLVGTNAWDTKLAQTFDWKSMKIEI